MRDLTRGEANAAVRRLVAERDSLKREVEAARQEVAALRRERDRAVETRENANTVSVRVEGENQSLKREVDRLARAIEDHAAKIITGVGNDRAHEADEALWASVSTAGH